MLKSRVWARCLYGFWRISTGLYEIRSVAHDECPGVVGAQLQISEMSFLTKYSHYLFILEPKLIEYGADDKKNGVSLT